MSKLPFIGPASNSAKGEKPAPAGKLDAEKKPKQLQDMTLNDWRAAIAKVFDEFRIRSSG